MSIGAIILMSFITLVLGFACVLVIDNELRGPEEEKKIQLD